MNIPEEAWLFTLGFVGWIAIAHFEPKLKSLNQSTQSLEQISGIDLDILNQCRQAGLI